MARIEVEESDILAASQLTATVQGMLSNPKARELLLQAQKIVKPDTIIPEIDARDQIMSKVDAIAAEMAADRAARAAEKEAEKAERESKKFERQWNSQRENLRAAGYLDDGIAKIEALAQQRGIPDLEAAEALFQKLNPPPAPVVGTAFSPLESFTQPTEDNKFMKALLETKGESQGALNGLVNQAVNEFRQGNRR